MRSFRRGAQEASSRRARSLGGLALAALLLATSSTIGAPGARAAAPRVVVVVGPVGSATSSYRDTARKLAALARTNGAEVVEVYSPNATWSRVAAAAKGANLLVYLGHGNGWPSPYHPFSVYTKDGLGLNATAGAGDANLKYYGEYYMPRLALAPNAVVLLHKLCYASGNSEWTHANPTRDTAIKRIDNYGAGFLRSGARAVFAYGLLYPGWVVRALLTADPATTMARVFWTDPNRTYTYRFSFASTRTAGATAWSDPYATSRYYRSAIGWLGTTVGDWRRGAPAPSPTPAPSASPAPSVAPSASAAPPG